jgi:Rhodopirellula transposase DDE domain
VKATDAIFEQLAELHAQARADDTILRLSLDAKATLDIGPFSRRGQTRVHLMAADHDFKPEDHLTPYGIFLPGLDELYLYFTSSSVTADFIVDCLTDFWKEVRASFPVVTTLLLNLDNGPENHSRRTQFMARLTAFADAFGLTIQLAYYPPYHSKYNPIERVWGVLEQHWNGDLLDSRQTVLRLASTMTYNGFSPFIHLVETVYQTGIRLSARAMAGLEQRFERLAGLEKWFVRIVPSPP